MSPGRPPAGPALRPILVGALALLLSLSFVGLGVWQLQRRAWKLQLIAAVDRRVAAPPVPAPGPVEWTAVTAADSAYRHVRARGVFLNGRDTLVQAVTELGPGFWVMSPLRTDAGFTVLVNRGFVPLQRRDAYGRPVGPTTVTGLLRISEPGGGFLRRNAPADGRWYSRDVSAIAAARGLGPVAPYFIDADGAPNPGGWPVGGLTVVRFPNSHLAYALTWFGLAALSLFGGAAALRAERPPSRSGSG